MANPVSRRRPPEDDAPDADKYSRSRDDRDAPADDDGDDRRPRRGRERGELPPRRSRDDEPEDDGDAPRSRRSRDDDDEPRRSRDDRDDEPRSRRSRDDDEPRRSRDRDEDEPRSRRSRDDGDDEPRGRSRDRDDEPRGRSRGRDDRDADEPRGRSRSRDDDDRDSGGPRRQAKGGFESYQRSRAATSSFADDFKIETFEQIVKFLDDEPFDTFEEHFLEELPQGQKKSYVCIAELGDCPLCKIGDKPKSIALFNIVQMPLKGEPKVKVLRATPAIAKLLENKAALQTGPLGKHYYSLSKEDKKRNEGAPDFYAEVIRARDLEDDYKMIPFTDRELDDFDREKAGDGFVTFPKKSDLQGIARVLDKRD